MNIVLDTPEAAERAAWMLRGDCIKENQVEVPENNTNSERNYRRCGDVGRLKLALG
jgi:hypothetical protein